MTMKQNWDWVRATYNPSIGTHPGVADEPMRFPSCVANGLSERQKRALMKVFDAACLRAATKRNN